MPRPRTALAPLLAAAPALAVAGVGLLHPVFLTPDTAERWRLAHLLLLPGFPLVAAAVWGVLRGTRGLLADAARLLSAAYALLYGALDSIAGIGAPHQVLGAARRGEPGPPIGDLYEIGDRLGHTGVYALGLAAVAAAVALYRSSRSPLAPAGGVVVVLACVPFYRFHVFPPRGVLAMVALGAGLALLELGRRRPAS